MSRNAIYVLDSSGKITQMFVGESGFSVVKDADTYTFSNHDSTIPIHVFNVMDKCTSDEDELYTCLSKTEIVDLTQPFAGNVLYVLIPNFSLTKYSVATGTEITMSQEGQIIVHVSPGSEPEETNLSTTSITEPDIYSTQVEPDYSIGSSTVPESGEHEIVTAFNIAKNIADAIIQLNSSNSTATTASMTPNTWSKFG